MGAKNRGCVTGVTNAGAQVVESAGLSARGRGALTRGRGDFGAPQRVHAPSTTLRSPQPGHVCDRRARHASRPSAVGAPGPDSGTSADSSCGGALAAVLGCDLRSFPPVPPWCDRTAPGDGCDRHRCDLRSLIALMISPAGSRGWTARRRHAPGRVRPRRRSLCGLPGRTGRSPRARRRAGAR